MHPIADICTMRILIVAAARQEIEQTINWLEDSFHNIPQHSVDILLTGVGLLSSSYILCSSIFQHKPDFILQAGIAGSFSNKYPPGIVVVAGSEIVGDCGVMEDQQFRDIFDLELADANVIPFVEKKLVNHQVINWNKLVLPIVNGVTVNEITTDPKRITILKEKYQADIETMEGASLHFIALQQKIPFIQLRAISNFVGERNKKNWKIKEALTVLNNSLITLIQEIR